MAILPLGTQFEDRIVLHERERVSTNDKDASDAAHVVNQIEKAGALQAALGLGNPKASVQRHKEAYAEKTKLMQAEKLAQKFKAVKEPNPLFFPRFVKGSSFSSAGMPSANIRGRLPQLVMAELGPGVERIHCSLTTDNATKNYEAQIPVMPLTALEMAKRAKEMAPDAKFHLLFMPSWEVAPQRDPVLVVHIPGTDEWFQVAAWDGDVALIEEFLENK